MRQSGVVLATAALAITELATAGPAITGLAITGLAGAPTMRDNRSRIPFEAEDLR